jgi:hypothetical protein
MPHLHSAYAASPIAAQIPDPVRQQTGGDGLLHSLQGQDPINAQKTACDAISRILESDQVGPIHLEALLELDLHAQQIGNRLLNRYVDGDDRSRSFDLRDWISALRLGKKFCQAYERLLRHTQDTSDHYWLAHAHFVLVKLFHHRQTEFLLRFIRFKKRIPGQWKEIHEAYKYALMRGIAMHSVAGDAEDSREMATTPEQQYIRLLLLEVINNGQFSPRDALWADGWFNRWSRGLRLEWRETATGINVARKGFVVDLDGSDGLRRPASAAPRNPLYLDPTPLAALIDKELESLRSPDAPGDSMTPATRAGKVALLNKLKAIYAPVHVQITRRGEREPVALAIQLVTGLPSIIQILREEARTRASAAPTPEPQLDAITFSPLGAATDSPALAAGDGIGSAPAPGAGPAGVAQESWQVRDRSDSGSRIRGQIDDLNRVIPGSLIAIRESEDAPWTVSVVRRFRRLMVNFVELGVEHIGRKPSVVKLVAEPSGTSSIGESGDHSHRSFVALYLPPSERQPMMPIKTLLLPVRKFSADSKLTLLSSKSSYTLRLNEPIQQQFEYLWTSFTVIEHAKTSNLAQSIAAAYS